MSHGYETKQPQYFSHARVEIAPLLPKAFRRVLEIGCGSGATLAWIRRHQACDYVAGVEVSEAHANEARNVADRVVVGDAEALIDSEFAGEEFDLVLCLDVLEHMVDPWDFVSRLSRLMSATGTIVFSIPNVRNLRVVLPLLLRGQWTYEDEGILDRTHLRFFTRKSALGIASTPPLIVQRILDHVPPRPSRLGLLNVLTFGLMADFLAVQFLIASRLDGPATPERHGRLTDGATPT